MRPITVLWCRVRRVIIDIPQKKLALRSWPLICGIRELSLMSLVRYRYCGRTKGKRSCALGSVECGELSARFWAHRHPNWNWNWDSLNVVGLVRNFWHSFPISCAFRWCYSTLCQKNCKWLWDLNPPPPPPHSPEEADTQKQHERLKIVSSWQHKRRRHLLNFEKPVSPIPHVPLLVHPLTPVTMPATRNVYKVKCESEISI